MLTKKARHGSSLRSGKEEPCAGTRIESGASAFYTNITHELRTPLTLILGPLEDMQKSNSLSNKDAQKISVIHQSAIRLLNLINQILEFRKTETQNKKLCVAHDNIANLVYEIGLKYKELNRKPNIEFHIELEKTICLCILIKK